MKNKFYVLLITASVLVNLSRQHDAKGGSFSGSFSSSSSSSQSSSFSSSSSSSFSATGSFNGIGGLKNLAGGLAGAGANAGAGAFASGSGSAGGGTGFGDSVKGGGFANAGGQSTSGAGFVGGVSGSGLKGTAVGGSGGDSSGSSGGSGHGSGGVGSSCGFGVKNCGVSGSLENGAGGSLGGPGSGSFGISSAGSAVTTGSGVGGVQSGTETQLSGTGNIGNDEGTFKDTDQKLPTGNVFESSGDTNVIAGSTGSSGNYNGNVIPTKPTPLYTQDVSGTGGASSSSGSSTSVANVDTEAAKKPLFVPNPNTQDTLSNPQPTHSYNHGPGYGTTTIPKKTLFFYPQPGSSIGVGSTTNYAVSGSGSQGVGDSGNLGITTVTQGVKKPCCTGPFPGPFGSIYDSKPASSVPPVHHPGGSFSSTGITSGGTFGSHSGGAFGGNVGSVTGSKGPCCKGPFPGPNGSIHDYKLASSVHPVPGAHGHISSPLPSTPSHVFGGNVATGSGSTVATGTSGVGTTVEFKPLCCKKFPGPNTGIHHSIPASSVTSSGTSTSNAASTANTGLTSTTFAIGNNGADTIKVKQNTQYNTPVVPSGIPAGDSIPTTVASTVAVASTGSQSSAAANSASQAGTHFAGHTYYAEPHYTKPNHPAPTWNKDISSGNGHVTVHYKVPQPSIYLHPPVESQVAPIKMIILNEYKPLNPDFLTPGKQNVVPSTLHEGQIKQEQPDTTQGLVTGGVYVQKPHTDVPSATSDSNVNYADGIEQPPSAINTGSVQITNQTSPEFGTDTVGADKPKIEEKDKTIGTIGVGPGFASGTLIITKPYQTPNLGNKVFSNVQFVEAPGNVAVAAENTDGDSVQSHSESSFKRPIVSFGTSFTGNLGSSSSKSSGSSYGAGSTGTTGGSFVSTQPVTSSGSSDTSQNVGDNGFATGSVIIQKPDGSETNGNDITSGGAISGNDFNNKATSSGSYGGSASIGTSGGHSFGYSGGSTFGAGGSGLFGGHSGFKIGSYHKGPGSGPFSSFAGANSGAGSYSSANGGSSSGIKGVGYAGASSGAGASGHAGLLGDLFGKHGLGGNLGISGSGSFAKSGAFSKSQAFASSSSYAGASSGSFSGHY